MISMLCQCCIYCLFNLLSKHVQVELQWCMLRCWMEFVREQFSVSCLCVFVFVVFVFWI